VEHHRALVFVAGLVADFAAAGGVQPYKPDRETLFNVCVLLIIIDTVYSFGWGSFVIPIVSLVRSFL
jgi:hypothetical protein